MDESCGPVSSNDVALEVFTGESQNSLTSARVNFSSTTVDSHRSIRLFRERRIDDRFPSPSLINLKLDVKRTTAEGNT